MRICKIENCNEKHKGMGYCLKHYQRFEKYGDPFYIATKEPERHGMTGIPEYSIWYDMKRRCYNKRNKAYHWYGKKGIIICDKWINSFLAFYEDMGPKPFPGAEIDRIDNDKGYFPENCRWTTHTENIRNSSIAKITIKIARDIKKIYKTSKITQKELVMIYGCSQVHIGRIVNDKAWKP